MLLMIDNYDSFTWNLVQYFRELGESVAVYHHDRITCQAIAALKPRAIVISPGPGTPDDAGISLDVIRRFQGTIPLLGICLGHQSIGQVYGASIVRARQVMHGKVSTVYHTGSGLFTGLPNPLTATRYHSLILAPETLPDCLEVTAWTQGDDGRRDAIMGIRHRHLPVAGVQFHPESILTAQGQALLANFLRTCSYRPYKNTSAHYHSI